MIKEQIMYEALDGKMYNTKKGAENHNTPIIRQTIVGVNAITRLSLNLQRFNQYTDKYLTHGFKIVPNMEAVELSDKVSTESLNNSDIVVVFKEWKKSNGNLFSFEEKMKESVMETAQENLVVSRDEMLTND